MGPRVRGDDTGGGLADGEACPCTLVLLLRGKTLIASRRADPSALVACAAMAGA